MIGGLISTVILVNKRQVAPILERQAVSERQARSPDVSYRAFDLRSANNLFLTKTGEWSVIPVEETDSPPGA